MYENGRLYKTMRALDHHLRIYEEDPEWHSDLEWARNKIIVQELINHLIDEVFGPDYIGKEWLEYAYYTLNARETVDVQL